MGNGCDAEVMFPDVYRGAAFRCELPAGHDGGHHAQAQGVVWRGQAQPEVTFRASWSPAAPRGAAELLGLLRYLIRRQRVLERAGVYDGDDEGEYAAWGGDDEAELILAAAARALGVRELDRY
ncbi:MAG: hypothetical protein JWO67_39 [Streptosporangiaceae bacterium]|nr:hypothetical protein [Streptosporangiaceae bacterium]